MNFPGRFLIVWRPGPRAPWGGMPCSGSLEIARSLYDTFTASGSSTDNSEAIALSSLSNNIATLMTDAHPSDNEEIGQSDMDGPEVSEPEIAQDEDVEHTDSSSD